MLKLCLTVLVKINKNEPALHITESLMYLMLILTLLLWETDKSQQNELALSADGRF